MFISAKFYFVCSEKETFKVVTGAISRYYVANILTERDFKRFRRPLDAIRKYVLVDCRASPHDCNIDELKFLSTHRQPMTSVDRSLFII